MDEDAAHARIRSQAPDAARRAIADVVIDTAGTLEDTVRQVDALWSRLSG
jgi:dephospho-CoA kinase